MNSKGVQSGNSPAATVIIGTKNYVRTLDVFSPSMKTLNDLTSLNADQKALTYEYVDGLGRQVQRVGVGVTPNRKDIVEASAYDAFGRQPFQYAPYADGGDGAFKEDALKDPYNLVATNLLKYRTGKQFKFYQQDGTVANDQYPYAEVRLERSPLSRIIKMGSVGSDWQPDGANSIMSTDRTKKSDSQSNSTDEVLL